MEQCWKSAVSGAREGPRAYERLRTIPAKKNRGERGSSPLGLGWCVVVVAVPEYKLLPKCGLEHQLEPELNLPVPALTYGQRRIRCGVYEQILRRIIRTVRVIV